MKRLMICLALFATAVANAETSATPPQLPGKVAIAQKLGNQLPLDTIMHDEYGNVVRLGDYFRSGRPVLLNFVYFRCPMLCPIVLQGMASAMSDLRFNVGEQYDVLSISIDPRDTPQQALQFKDKYVKLYGRLSTSKGWHFLTGNDTNIHRITDAVGFQYAYDGTRDQFAHGAAMFVLTPEARVSRYFFGFEFPPRDLRLGIVEASGRKIGNVTDAILLLCYHYDPVTGRYSRVAMNFMRAGGITTVAALAGFIFIMIRKERRAGNV